MRNLRSIVLLVAASLAIAGASSGARLSGGSAPAPCATVPAVPLPTSTNGSGAEGPPGSWCIPSVDVGPYGTDNSKVAVTLGVHVIHLSPTVDQSLTLSLPSGGYYSGPQAGVYTIYATYVEDAAKHAAVAVGSTQVMGQPCAQHASSCTFVFPKAYVAAGAATAQWLFLPIYYFYGAKELAYGDAAIELINPGAPTTTPPPPTSSPSLQVTLAAPGTSKGVNVGHTVSVTVKVTAKSGKVSSISLAPGLAATTPAAVVTKQAPGLSGFSLASGTSRSFTFRVKTAKSGNAALGIHATGKAAAGSVSDSASLSFKVGASALLVTLNTLPTTVALKVDDDGNIVPAHVSVAVRFKNTTNATIAGITLVSLRPEPADQTQALKPLAFPAKALPVAIGTLGPGGSARKTLTLKVDGDGEYQIRALALYHDPSRPGGNGRAVGAGGDFEATVPPLFFSAKVDQARGSITKTPNGASFVKGGSTWYLSGTIKDESSYQHLCVLPLIPALAGNASGTGPDNITDPLSVREIGGPFAGELRPGQDVSLTMYVDTSAEGGTRGTVGFKPAAGLLSPGSVCNSITAPRLKMLGPSDIVIPKGGSDFVMHVDVSQPAQIPVTNAGVFVNFFAGLGEGIAAETFDQAVGLVALAQHAVTTNIAFSDYIREHPLWPLAAYQQATLTAAQALYVATDVYANYWRTASPFAKKNVIFQAVSVLLRTGYGFWVALDQTVSAAAQSFMQDAERIYASGDDAQVWRLWGQLSGSAVQQLATFVFMDVLGAKLAKSATELEKVAAAETAAWEKTAGTLPVDVALETVPAGAETVFSERASLWGIDRLSDNVFAKLSKKYDVLIGVRGRAPASIEKLEQGAVWKHENLKPKNVNQIDVKYLGFNQSDLAEVRFRTYTNQQVATITQNIQNASLTVEQRAAVLDRFETRLGEEKYVKKIETYAKKGEIDVGFNYRDNGLNRPNTRQYRRFDLESAPIPAEGDVPAGGTYYTPLQENPDYASLAKGNAPIPPECKRLLGSVLCKVTGDIDGVYITTLDGGAVPPQKLLALYKDLQAAGWQHPETLTWINNQGQFYFGAKAKILQGLEQGGGEAMIEYAPDGERRATYLNLKQSSLVGSADYRVQIVGGYTAKVVK